MTGYLRHWSERGAAWAQDVVLLKPCHLWPYLRNRTVWFVGDSMTQVSLPSDPKIPLAAVCSPATP